ncbi:MAG: N-acetylmuramoyl-L-alanine amidase [Deltaproteobacteria bacterium]|nr:N-acetylmuramoyl-L-alanine amidase [Deltaproteobacteria bacterium]
MKIQTAPRPTPSYPRIAPSLDEAGEGALIRLGMRGEGVRQLQRALVERGYALEIDGLYGPKTRGAVEKFQRTSQIRVDGLVGPETVGALRKAAEPAANAPAANAPVATVPAAPPPTETLGAVRTGEPQAPTEVERLRGPAEGEVRAGELARIDDWRRTERTRERSAPFAKPPMVEKPSRNHSSRGGEEIDSIVIHDTGSNSTAGALSWLRNPDSGVSAHYVVGKDGTIYHLVPDERAAWHAGRSSLHGERSPSVNARSIGIEIVNDGSGRTPFTDPQYASVRALVGYLSQTYQVPKENIVGHKDVAPGRKVDPAPNFAWGRIIDDGTELA